MSDSPIRQSAKPPRYRALKIALIPALGLVLYSLMPGDGASGVPAPGTQLTSPPPSSPVVGTKPSPPILAIGRPVEQIASQDPFALPEALFPPVAPTDPLEELLETDAGSDDVAPTEAEAWEATRRRWTQERTSVVLATPKGPVAVVGDRMLRIGDEVEPGLRVVDIRADGIVLEATGE